MALIDVYLSNIAAAVYGSEMRSNIYSAMSEMAAGVVDVASAVEAFQAAMPQLSEVMEYTGYLEMESLIAGPGLLSGSIGATTLSSLRNRAFADCYEITAASFPNCRSIGSSAFFNCGSLATVYFPECLRIEEDAFIDCGQLQSISFPKCQYIGGLAFAYCSSLSVAYFLGSSVPSMDNSVFWHAPISSIYVLPSMVDEFIYTSGWADYANIIIPYE